MRWPEKAPEPFNFCGDALHGSTGPQFRHRIEAIIENFTDMQLDLDRERKTMMRIWAKREAQLKGVLDSSAGLYGDLQGIAGRAMPEIEGLGPLMIESKSTSTVK